MAELRKTSADHKHILCDLFETIQCILTDDSCVTKDVTDDVILFKIRNYPNLPTVLLMYDDIARFDEDVTQLSDSNSELRGEDDYFQGSSSPIPEESPEKLNDSFHVSNYVETIYDQSHPQQTSFDRVLPVSASVGRRKNVVGSAQNIVDGAFLKSIVDTPIIDLEPFPTAIHVSGETSLFKHSLSEAAHTCKFCGKSFESMILKIQHETVHAAEKGHRCKYCKKLFKRLQEMVRHERIHTGEKPYKCDFCSKSFTQSYTKKEHERIHTGEKPYACGFCEKSFNSLGNKKKHERTHTGVKPYSCGYCPKTFTTSDSKNYHEALHTGQKPHKCNYCEKTFCTGKDRVKHERIHTGERPYSCKFCGKTFGNTGSRINHEKLHTADNLYKCDFCSKSFKQQQQKRSHELIHTGEKPYSCNYCDKKFTRLDSKRYHENIHKRQMVPLPAYPVATTNEVKL